MICLKDIPQDVRERIARQFTAAIMDRIEETFFRRLMEQLSSDWVMLPTDNLEVEYKVYATGDDIERCVSGASIYVRDSLPGKNLDGSWWKDES